MHLVAARKLGIMVSLAGSVMFPAGFYQEAGDQESDFKIARPAWHIPGIDARRFAFNIMHWLSGLLD